MNTTLEVQCSEELIIRGGQVYNREVFESPIGHINEIIQDACVTKKYETLPVMFPSLLRSNWVLGHYFTKTPKDYYHVITEISYIPFARSCLRRVGEGLYKLHPRSSIPEGTTSPQYLGPFEELKWVFPSTLRMFILMESHLPPLLFGIDKNIANKEPICPKLPNVFSNGKICTGRDYAARMGANSESVPSRLITGLDAIRTAPPNSDLRENDEEFMLWDENANTVTRELAARHYRKCTDERILEFAQFINSNVTIHR